MFRFKSVISDLTARDAGTKAAILLDSYARLEPCPFKAYF